MELRFKQALYLSWAEAAEQITSQIFCALGQDVPCDARLMDERYWAIFSREHEFTRGELVALLTYAGAKPDVCAEVFSIEDNTTGSLTSGLGTLLLKRALRVNWQLEYPTETWLWLLDVTMEACAG